MKVSIVIPAFNEEKLLPAALEAVRQASAAFLQRRWATEVVVCDNHSTDATAAIATRAGAVVAFEPVNQIARARNTGARATTGDWLIFVDADSQPTAGLFESVARQIERGDCVGGGSTVRIEGTNRVAVGATALWNLISRCLRWMAGSFVFIDAVAFRELGGFSEELFASEEIDLSQRLKRLARRQHRRVVILTQHPLLTSARRVQLYTPLENFRFFVRMMCNGRRGLRTREGCGRWYDGRR